MSLNDTKFFQKMLKNLAVPAFFPGFVLLLNTACLTPKPVSPMASNDLKPTEKVMPDTVAPVRNPNIRITGNGETPTDVPVTQGPTIGHEDDGGGGKPEPAPAQAPEKKKKKGGN